MDATHRSSITVLWAPGRLSGARRRGRPADRRRPPSRKKDLMITITAGGVMHWLDAACARGARRRGIARSRKSGSGHRPGSRDDAPIRPGSARWLVLRDRPSPQRHFVGAGDGGRHGAVSFSTMSSSRRSGRSVSNGFCRRGRRSKGRAMTQAEIAVNAAERTVRRAKTLEALLEEKNVDIGNAASPVRAQRCVVPRAAWPATPLNPATASDRARAASGGRNKCPSSWSSAGQTFDSRLFLGTAATPIAKIMLGRDRGERHRDVTARSAASSLAATTRADRLLGRPCAFLPNTAGYQPRRTPC